MPYTYIYIYIWHIYIYICIYIYIYRERGREIERVAVFFRTLCVLAVCRLPFDLFPSPWMVGVSVLTGRVPRLEVFGNSWLDVAVLGCLLRIGIQRLDLKGMNYTYPPFFRLLGSLGLEHLGWVTQYLLDAAHDSGRRWIDKSLSKMNVYSPHSL